MLPPSPTVRRAFDLMQAGQRDQAEQIVRRHLQKEPRDATALHVLAATLLAKGQHAQAAFFATKANALFPHDYAILSVLGTALTASGNPEAAIEIYREATTLAPHIPTLWSGLGVTLMASDRLDEAIPAFERCLSLDPREPSGFSNLSVCYTRLGDAASAYRVAKAALAHFPQQEGMLLQAATAANYLDTLAPGEVRAEHDALARAIESKAPSARAIPAEPLDGRPLRIGFLSADFYDHSCSFFLEPILAHFADGPARHEAQVEILCYSATHRSDDVTRRLCSLGHPWRDVLSLSDAACADAIRSDKIDILIDCNGYTNDTRVQVLTHRAAPVQMSYLGYPNTTGLRECDGRIVDSITDPPGSEGLSSESLIRLDPHFLCYTPLRSDRIAPINPEPPSTRKGHVTFGSFNLIMKVSESTIATWAGVLRAVPGSRLLLKAKHAGARSRVLRQFESHGIDPHRITLLLPVDSPTDHMALYNDIDVALDPFPYNGTTTTYQTIAMGVPVVTLLGDRHAARVGASILSALGLSEWVAQSTDEYVTIATNLARDTSRLAACRQELRGRLVASAVCDRPAFASHFARAMHGAWSDRLRSLGKN